MKRKMALATFLLFFCGVTSAFNVNININTNKDAKPSSDEHKDHDKRKKQDPPPAKHHDEGRHNGDRHDHDQQVVDLNVSIQASGKDHHDESKSGSSDHVDRYTFVKQNGEQRLSLTSGTFTFAIPASSLPRDWKWHKIFFQVSSIDNAPLGGVVMVTSASTNLGGYSQQVVMSDPGRGKDAIFSIKCNKTRKVKVNWWVAN